jgi:hypothetical protein
MNRPQGTPITLTEKRLLSKILNASELGRGVDAAAFRAEHVKQIERLEWLQRSRYLVSKDDRYQLSLAAVADLGSPKSKRLLSDMTAIYPVFVRSYRAAPRKPVSLTSIADATKLPEQRVREAVAYMLEAPWHAGHSTNMFAGPAETTTVSPAEAALRNPSWRSWVQTLRKQREEDAVRDEQWAASGGNTNLLANLFESTSQGREGKEDVKWHADLPEDLKSLLGELTKARKHGLRWLVAIGLRGVVEVVADSLLGVNDKTFKGKLDALRDARQISLSDYEALGAVIEVGNASAHRGHTPEDEDLAVLSEIVEHLLKRRYVLDPAAARAKSKAPVRRKAA